METESVGLIASIISGYPTWLTAIISLISGATALTALTPTKVDNKILGGTLKVLNLVAGNVLKNRNKDE
jgi:hypothetical protein|tara:strand:- start:1542 stop:1748 length:207 start_codon:yes stop_codon:yes gene_type:complete